MTPEQHHPAEPAVPFARRVPELNPREAYALWADNYPPCTHNPFMRAEERALLSLLPADLEGLSVLDAGCGSGRYLAHAARHNPRSLIGVDSSAEMLSRARAEWVTNPPGGCPGEAVPRSVPSPVPSPRWIQADLRAIPLPDGWADLTFCGLVLGHLEDLQAGLAALRRVTRPGGTLLCSDLHPIGQTLGWQRRFTVRGQEFAVRHTTHPVCRWRQACRTLGLRVMKVLEPRLDPADLPPGARPDPVALQVPVALVLELCVEE